MKLGIMLNTGIDSENLFTVKKTSQAAIGQGHQVSIFLMNDGVYCIPMLKDLLDSGLELVVCAHNAHQRGVSKVEGVLFGSQYDWARIVNEADRVVTFG